jgi:hypothetical protein
MFSIEKTIEVLKDPEGYAPHVRREANSRAIGLIDKLQGKIDKLYGAMVGLVGASTTEDLKAMELIMRISPAPDDDKSSIINAIHVLIEFNELIEPIEDE